LNPGVPVFRARDVELAVTAESALAAVRHAFVAHFRGEWTMPPKLYVTNYPAGDFRAMPALGGGDALLKWVTSFPGNPDRELPTVSGLVLLSDASTGELKAVLEAGAVTALRTGAAAVLAAETLGRDDAETVAVVGAGVNGRATARAFLAHGHAVSIWDLDPARARAAADELGAGVAVSLPAALEADLLATVTPGHTPLLGEGSLAPGQHVSLMGADGPGKAEIATSALAPAQRDRGPAGTTPSGPRLRLANAEGDEPEPDEGTDREGQVRLFCDDWEQASHGGDLAHAVGAGLIGREDVTELGAVLAGEARGRRSSGDITIFDSTGLAIQDLAIARACLARAAELDLATLEL
jgi:alanine dehydrogenase